MVVARSLLSSVVFPLPTRSGGEGRGARGGACSFDVILDVLFVRACSVGVSTDSVCALDVS